jgi:hypothetical protein
MEYSTRSPKSFLSLSTTKTCLSKDSNKLYLRLDTNGKGGKGLGVFHQIVELSFDSNNRILVRYRTKDKSGNGPPYGYAVVGVVILPPPSSPNEGEEEI